MAIFQTVCMFFQVCMFLDSMMIKVLASVMNFHECYCGQSLLQLLYSNNILNDKNVIENTENILCTHFHYSNNILHDKNVIQNTEHIMHRFSFCNYYEKCGCVEHGLPVRMHEALLMLPFPGLLKSTMSILQVQSQNAWWEKFPLFISLKT